MLRIILIYLPKMTVLTHIPPSCKTPPFYDTQCKKKKKKKKKRGKINLTIYLRKYIVCVCPIFLATMLYSSYDANHVIKTSHDNSFSRSSNNNTIPWSSFLSSRYTFSSISDINVHSSFSNNYKVHDNSTCLY